MNLDVFLRRADAAKMAGVAPATLKNWYDRGWVTVEGERRQIRTRRTGQGRGVLTYRLGDVLDAAHDTGVNPRSPGRVAQVTVVGGEPDPVPAAKRAWAGSDRAERLPEDWAERRAEALRRNPRQVCHWCGLPGGTDLDHKRRGDDHQQENLDWIHSWRDVEGGRAERNCHGEKSSAEGVAARVSRFRPREKHPGLL